MLVLLGEKVFYGIKFFIEVDAGQLEKAKKLLLQVAENENKKYAVAAMDRLTQGVQQGQWQKDLKAYFQTKAEDGDFYAALYLGWYLLSKETREAI